MTRDRFVTAVTGLLLLMFGAVVVTTAITFRTAPTGLAVLALLLAITVCGAIVAAAYLYTPKALELGPSALTIQRPIGAIEIPYASIRSVQLSDEWFGSSLKRPPGGNSGFFGIWGAFRSRTLGSYTMYGTRARGAVILMTTSGTVVVTPDERDPFTEDLRRRARPANDS